MKKIVLLAYCISLLFSSINASSHTPTIEIELKYEILDINLLNPFLQTLEYQKTQSTHDVYFDTPQGAYFKKGLWIRNRNNRSLDFKFNRAGLLDQSKPMTNFCEEHSFQLPLNAYDRERLIALSDFLQLQVPDYLDLQAFTMLNGLQEMAIVNKIRKTYQHQKFKIMVDEIKDVGYFLE